MDECEQAIRKKGYVQDMFGRRYHVSRRKAYKAVNALVQGGCAQVLKIALIKVERYLTEEAPTWQGKRAHVLMLLHDELILEMPKRMPTVMKNVILLELKERMEYIRHLIKVGIRMKIDIKKSTKSWEDKEEYNVLAA